MNDATLTNALDAARDRRAHALASLKAFIALDALHQRMKVREAEIRRDIEADKSFARLQHENEFRNRIIEDTQLTEDVNKLAELKHLAFSEKIEAEYSHDLHETYVTFTKEVG